MRAIFTSGSVGRAPGNRCPPHRPGLEDFPHPVPRFSDISDRETNQATPRLAHNFAARLSDIMNYFWQRKGEGLLKFFELEHSLVTASAEPIPPRFLCVLVGYFKGLVVTSNSKVLIEAS